MELFKKAVKNTLLFGLVGVALALLAPPLMAVATSLGVSQAFAASTLAATSAVWSGVFFGAFGALAVVATPVMDWLFHDGPNTAQHRSSNGLSIVKSRGVQPQFDLPNPSSEQHFQEKLAASRALPEHRSL